MKIPWSLPVSVVLVLGCALASLPGSGSPNGAISSTPPGVPNVVVKVVPVYVKPYSPTIQVPPPEVKTISSSPSLWDEIWTVLLTLATVAQAAVAAFLYRAANRQAEAANKQVTAANSQAAAAKEQVSAATKQIEVTREQLEEARLQRFTSERPMLSLEIYEDTSDLANHQHRVPEGTGELLLATRTTIRANNHGNVPSYDTNVTVRIQPDAQATYSGFCKTLPFNVVPAGGSVSTTVEIFQRVDYETFAPTSSPVPPLEVQLSTTYRNTHDVFFRLSGRWTVKPFNATASTENILRMIRFSWWNRASNETITGITQEEAIADACGPDAVTAQS